MGHLGLKTTSRRQGRLGMPRAGNATLSDMTGEDKEARDFAHQAYEKPEERASSHKGYELDKDLSDKTTAVYHNPTTKQNYIGFRGTADMKDLFTDTLDPRGNIVRGTQRNNPVYKADLKKYDAVKAKYGGDTRVSGHSLGGSRAKFVSRERNAHGQSFNLGSGLDKTMLKDKLRCNNPIKSMRPAFCDKFTAHHVKGDALSVTHNLGYGKHKKYAYKNPTKAHFLGNWKPMDDNPTDDLPKPKKKKKKKKSWLPWRN